MMVLLGPLVTFLSQPEQKEQLSNFQYNRNYPIYKLSQKIQIPATKSGAKDESPASKLSEILVRCGYIGLVYVWNAFPADDAEAYVLRDSLSIKEQADKYIGVDFVDIGKPLSSDPQVAVDGQFEVRPGEFYLTLIKRNAIQSQLSPSTKNKSKSEPLATPKQVTTISNPRFYEAFLHRATLTDPSNSARIVEFAKNGGTSTRKTTIVKNTELFLR